MAIGRLETVVLEARDPGALARFYSQLLGLPVTYEDGEWVTIGDATARLGFQHAPGHQPPRWPDPASSMQLHLDLRVDDIERAEADVLALGASRLWGSAEEKSADEGQPGPSGFRVYVDPEGHPFCLCWG